MTGTDANRGITGINVTPLIDVLLVLLIIFMVIVPVTSRGLSSNIPQPPKHSRPDPEDTVVLQIATGPRGQLTYLLNQAPLAKSEIAGRLVGIFASRQHPSPWQRRRSPVRLGRPDALSMMSHASLA